MSNECCKELSGWCCSFTKVERALTILEGILLTVLLFCIVFVVLHLIVCYNPLKNEPQLITDVEDVNSTSTETPEMIDPEIYQDINNTEPLNITKHKSIYNTLNPKIKCTWQVSVKTTPQSHYYEKENKLADLVNDEKDFITDGYDDSDGELADDTQKAFVRALVKVKPPNDITFGCILTIISEYWTLTAASCIESIEELESLDSFVIMENYGEAKQGKLHTIADLQVHPFYEETNKSYDIAALRSEDSLLSGSGRPVELVFLVDNAIITIGERLHLLGYGAFRSMGSGGVRAARVHRLPRRACGAGGGAGAARRHLARGRVVPAAPPVPPLACAGVMFGRARPCNYCGGAPLLHGAALLALMQDNPQCGISCEPHLYVPIAHVRDWIDALPDHS